MKIAAAAYPLDFLSDWDTYEEKTRTWVDRAAEAGADLLVFPEYGRMELATLDGAEAAGDLERSLHAAARWTEKADALIEAAARKHGVHILAGSGPVFDGGERPVNRASFFGPEGPLGYPGQAGHDPVRAGAMERRARRAAQGVPDAHWAGSGC
jgi:predicted amidohydrolase